MSFLVRRPGGAKPEPKVYYPRALVVLTVTMETMQDAKDVPLKQFDVAVKPLSVRITRNDYKAADEFTAEMDVRACPITPKQIRRATVGIWVWSSQSDTPPVDPDGNYLVKPAFEGFVEEVTANYEDGGHTVTISGADYTTLFTHRQWKEGRRMPAGRRIDQHLQELIDEAQPGSENGPIRLRVEPASLLGELGVVGAVATRTNKKGKPVKEKSNFWDVMYKMALREGCIMFVEGNEVVLTRPNRLHESRATGESFTSSGRPVYSLAWGRNLLSLEIQRNFNKEQQPVIKAIGRTPKGTISAIYPSRAEAKTAVGVGTDLTREELVTPFEGVTTVAALKLYARLVYELRAKGEQSISLTTEDMTDLNGADLMQARAGDAMGIDIDVFNRQELLRVDEGTRRRWLLENRFPERAADYIAANLDAIDQLKGPFRVAEVTINFDAENGVSLDARLQDYVRQPEEAV